MLLVLGSINMDLAVAASELPRLGETVIGQSFHLYPGGKGANQAVCAARLGASVCFLGMVGEDSYGNFMLREMAGSGVDVSRIERCELSTGIAAISVDARGQNSIIVVPGANFALDCAYIDRHLSAIDQCDFMLAQHETPIAITEYAFQMAKLRNKTTILNPAPAEPVSENMMALTDILVPNEHELSRLTGLPCGSADEIAAAAQALCARGIATVIVTMGAEGVLLVDKEGLQVFPAFSVTAVDTTAAGDSFLGGFAAAYAKERDLGKAIAYGQLVASYSIQHKGAQSSMPTQAQWEDYRNTFTQQ